MDSKVLFQAVRNNDLASVQSHLEALQETEGSNAKNALNNFIEEETGNTLLHVACENGNLEMSKVLFMSGMHLNEPNQFGHTALYYAAKSGNLTLTKWMISNGAEIDTDYSAHATKRDMLTPDMYTPLQVASFQGHFEVVNFLLECNAQVTGASANGITPLHLACEKNHREIVKALLVAGANADARDILGRTPIDIADNSLLSLLDGSEDVTSESTNGGVDDDEDDEFSSQKQMPYSVKQSFGTEIARRLVAKDWKIRLNAMNEVVHCMQNNRGNSVSIIKLFDAACEIILVGVNDNIAQVVSASISLLKTSFNAVMSDSSFHSETFHAQRPIISQIVEALLTRASGSNDKDTSEAISGILFLLCKSLLITNSLVQRIGQILNATGETSSSTWRLQLVCIKILNSVASQYRFDTSSGLGFQDSAQYSAVCLENSSVHVRTAAIDLLVQSVLIKCEQSEMAGSGADIYEQAKNLADSILKQSVSIIKPSVQAKINTGLKAALMNSKRLSSLQSAASPMTARGEAPLARPKTPGLSGVSSLKFEAPSADQSSGAKEEDLPYSEPISENMKEEVAPIESVFGEKVTRCLYSNAWSPRVEALSYLQHKIEARQVNFQKKDTVIATQKIFINALQDRVNAVFEGGVALLMEFIISYNGIVLAESSASKKLQEILRPVIPRLLIKFADTKAKLHVCSEDALFLISRQIMAGPEFVLEEISSFDRSSPQTSSVYLSNKLNIISKLVLEFGIKTSDTSGDLSIKLVLQPALQLCENKDQTVRTYALQIISEALRVARSATMPMLDSLARATRQKLISKLVENGVLESDMMMEEVDDFDIAPCVSRPGTSGGARPGTSGAMRPGTSSGARPPTASGASTKHRPALSNTSLSTASSSMTAVSAAQAAALPYGTALTTEQKEDHAKIIEVLGENIVRCLLDKAWAPREAAICEIERKVLCTVACKSDPNDPLFPKNLNTMVVLSEVIEIAMNDTVARVFQCGLHLLFVVVSEMIPIVSGGEQILQSAFRGVIELVMQKLGDSKQRIRQDCFTLLRSLAMLPHFGIAAMCRFILQKYPQVCSTSAVAMTELLKLLTSLIKENTNPSIHQNAMMRPDLTAILELLTAAFENKHLDVRNAAIEAYTAVYEVTNGGTSNIALFGAIDVSSCLAHVKPAIREAITRSIVQITKGLPALDILSLAASTAPENNDSARQNLTLDIQKLTSFSNEEITCLLTSPHAAQRRLGIEKLIDLYTTNSQHPKFKGAWEMSCLLCKQLFVDTCTSVTLAAFRLFELVVDPPVSLCATEFAIPWGEWGVHLILASTVRSVVQQASNEAVRIREQVKHVLQVVAAKNTLGRNAVCNAILSAPEQRDFSDPKMTKRDKKIALCKLRWQFLLRLELLYDFIVQDTAIGTSSASASGNNTPTKSPGGSSGIAPRRKSSSGTTSMSSGGGGRHETLGLDTVLPFIGSAVSHPSSVIRQNCRRIIQYLQTTRNDQVTKSFGECSAQLQKRLQCVMSDQAEDQQNNVNQFEMEDGKSRTSHVRNIAALRPPRSVPLEEKKLMSLGSVTPPQSAPGRGGIQFNLDNDLQSDEPQQRNSSSSNIPIWLDQSKQGFSSSPLPREKRQDSGESLRYRSYESTGSGRIDSGLFEEEEKPEESSIVGGGAVALVKVRRKSSFRSTGSTSVNSLNNGDLLQ